MSEPPPDLLWKIGVAVPFTWAFSKNHIYSLNARGHVHLREEHRNVREDLTLRLARALRAADVKVATNKLWIDILVEKASHKGDAVNVVDGVCDAVKTAVKLDDRWFCIRRLDWEVVPLSGKIYVSLGQDSDVESQVCSYCGRILPLSAFMSNKSASLGVSRCCTDCWVFLRAAQNAARKTARGAARETTEIDPT